MLHPVISLEQVQRTDTRDKYILLLGYQIGAKDVCCLVPQLVVDHQMNYAYVCGIITKGAVGVVGTGNQHTSTSFLLAQCRSRIISTQADP